MIRKPPTEETNPLGPYPELPNGFEKLADWWYSFQRVLTRRDEDLVALRAGGRVLNGTSDPVSTDGSNDDFYLNTTTKTLFGPKSNNAWPAGIPL